MDLHGQRVIILGDVRHRPGDGQGRPLRRRGHRHLPAAGGQRRPGARGAAARYPRAGGRPHRSGPGRPFVRRPGLRGLEVFGRDQRLVGDDVGPDPATGLVPAHPGLIAGGDVVDVQEDLVLALLVPDLPAGVAGVGEDGAYAGLGPGAAGTGRYRLSGGCQVAGPRLAGRGPGLQACVDSGQGVPILA
jgi:hypothetical protein